MKKARSSKIGKESKKTSALPKRELKPVDLGIVREQIESVVGNRAMEMVESTLEEVGKGHYLAMKCLFEMIELSPATTPEVALEEDSLAKILLRRLKLPEERYSGTKVTKDSVTDPVKQESDAVE
jgi:hypothetical protein